MDQYAGYEDSYQKSGEDCDLNNYISKISKGQFSCNICGKVGSQKFNLIRHVENKHFPGLYEYSCDKCESKFDSFDKFNTHRPCKHSTKK